MDQVEPPLSRAVKEPAGKTAPAWMFGLLVLPYAVYANGFVNTGLAALLTARHVPLDQVASIISVVLLPATLYFFWSPLVDFWLRRRTWVALASAVAGLFIGTALQLTRLASLNARMLLFLKMAVVMLTSCGMGGLMAAVVPAVLKTRASGFFTAGSLGFGALSGGGLVCISQHMGQRPFRLACGMMIALPGLLALTIPEPPVTAGGEPSTVRLRAIRHEFKMTFFKWSALPVLLTLRSPVGSGASALAAPAMAPD